MDTAKIESALCKLFHEEGQRIVFWNDPDHEFDMFLSAIAIDGVNVLRLDQIGAFEAKIKLEREDPTGKYLIYSASEEPEYEKDWLLDIRLYSRSFRADRASMILSELGLAQQQLRQHIADRRKFFDNKDRLRKIKELVAADDTDADLDRKMLAVVTKAEQPEFFTIVRTVFHDYLEGNRNGQVDLTVTPPAWEQVEKYDLDESFWSMVKANFGYDEQSPTLRNFLIRLLVTDFAHHSKGDISTALEHLVLPRSGRANTVVCLAQWRDSSSKGASYDALSAVVAEIISIQDLVQGYEVESLRDVMTFLEIEKAIMSGLRDRVMATAATIKAEEIRQIARRRQSGHWAAASAATGSDVPRSAISAVYDALVAAAEFLEFRNRHQSGFDYETPAAMFRAYETELFRFDQLYRLFCESADKAEATQWDVLKKLREQIEPAYANWFLGTLALSWGKFVDPHSSTGLLTKWQIAEVANQHRFYEGCVQPPLNEGENRRVFVIISDAFRYEAAEELTAQLNGKYRLQADLSSQLAVLPSYTALGMASLLPRKTLAYKATGEVLVNGKPVASFDQRNEILGTVNGMAVKADELTAQKKEEGREFIKGKQVVYIYHDTVDAVGDKQASEKDTFLAVRRAIDELAALVCYIVNNLNGNHILVTADHGFLFTESAPGETDKSAINFNPEGTVIAKKRYLLGHNLPDSDLAWHGRTAVTAGAAGDMEFWLPRGLSRFHFTGGARFVHGGATLQEVVVPVVLVKHRKDKGARDETKITTVTVHVLGSKHKITASRHRFELIQMEPVSERVKALTLRVAVYEGAEPVTNVETIAFDNASGNMDERKKWVQLVLKDRQYDKRTLYRLVLRDAATDVEHQSAEVTIDRAYGDDF
jgi:uncharacterized protein (TIGR02687 family)